jgi:hypothetical protein
MVSRSAPVAAASVAAASVTAPAVTVAKGEFEWHGPAHGWVRHVNGRRVAQDEFGVRDVQAWLETFGHDKVQEGFKAQQVDGPTFADLTDGDLRRLGNLYQVPQEVRYKPVLWCRVVSHTLFFNGVSFPLVRICGPRLPPKCCRSPTPQC